MTTRDGHRHIPIESLLKWKRVHSYDGPRLYKEAAAEAGMYDIQDKILLAKFKHDDE